MDLLTAHTQRHTQLKDLSEIAARYSQLQSEYGAQRLVLIDYKHQANYWKSQFEQQKKRETGYQQTIAELKGERCAAISKREEALQAEIAELQAALRKREHQLFGKKTEKGSKSEKGSHRKVAGRKRGKQPGTTGTGRRSYEALEVIEEELSLPASQTVCPCCGLSYSEFSDTEDSEVLEVIHVKAYRRKIRRKKYRRNCRCEKNTDLAIVTAPPAERLFPKTKIGLSIWASLLLKKYEYQQPLNRVLKKFDAIGLSLSAGTITDGLKKLIPLFEPIYAAIVAQSLASNHWHADETRWKVFETTEKKKNHQWWLWIFRNDETVIYKVHPTRSSELLKTHFGQEHSGGILSVDRYSAYKVIAKEGLFILAFCWAHVRRDFIAYAKGYQEDEDWAFAWVERIGTLYQINKKRLQYRQTSVSYRKQTQELQRKLLLYRQDIDTQLADEDIAPKAKKLLTSLINHWEGLTVFADNPAIPMDNNKAESGLRPPVVGRKNYYGSGAIWAAQLASYLFTLFETLKLHHLNQHTWLLAYLQACASNSGKAPDSIQHFLPWNMDDSQKMLFSKPPSNEET